jgi:cell division protein FtsQ
MTGSLPTSSRAELAQRRKQMRRQRRARALKDSWRFLVVAGLAMGAVWLTTQPTWVLRRSDQVKVEGNQFLSAQTIRSLLPIKYPQSIFRTQPSVIAATLKQKAPIIEASVDRQIFPPGLTVRIQERTPVAQLVDPDVVAANKETSKGEASKGETSKSDSKSEASKAGKAEGKSDASKTAPKESQPLGLKGHDLIDESGVVIPIESLNALNQTLKLPTLKILGRIEVIRPQWVDCYQLLRSSPVRIQQIDWRNPTNLVVTAESGTIYLGPYGPDFGRQLRAIDSMRRISEKLPGEQIDYIDLKNPDKPAIHKAGVKNAEKNNAP